MDFLPEAAVQELVVGDGAQALVADALRASAYLKKFDSSGVPASVPRQSWGVGENAGA